MGYIHVYTGNGKGKTTAAFGLAMRAVGRGKKVCIIQFMKPDSGYGEQVSAKRLGIEIHSFGTEQFVNRNNPALRDVQLAHDALTMAKEKVSSGAYDIVILDELNVALDFNLIDMNSVLSLINEVPERTELVITGRYAKQEILEKANLVTEMKEVKHYFREGIVAREGIEY